MPVTNFVWDELSDNVLLETDETNAVTARFTNFPEQFGFPISQERGGNVSYYHYDGNDSTRNLTDAAGNTTDTTIYSGCGEEVAKTGTTVNPFGYKGAAGNYLNPATEDLYVRARTYQPTQGRWLSPDPLGFVDGTSLYRAYFVPNGVDPTGKTVQISVPSNPVVATLVAAFLTCALPYYYFALSRFKDESDDFRHCWVSCAIAKTCSAPIAQVAGVGKEVRDSAVRIYCDRFPNDKWFCTKGHGDWWDSLEDLLANQQCVPWESYIPTIHIASNLWRETCECCCRRKKL